MVARFSNGRWLETPSKHYIRRGFIRLWRSGWGGMLLGMLLGQLLNFYFLWVCP